MAEPQFTFLPRAWYFSGQELLVQYGATRAPGGIFSNPENWTYDLVNTSSFVYNWRYGVPISIQDYQKDSNLAEDIGTGISKTFVQLVTQVRLDMGSEAEITNPEFNISFASYQSLAAQDDPQAIVTTWKDGARTALGHGYTCIFSSVGNVRT